MSSIEKGLGAKNASAELKFLPAKELKRSKRVVLVVIDGLGYAWLAKHGKGSFLAQYVRGSMTSVFPSTTATAMTTYYTGVAPRQHGFTGWFVNFKELGMTTAPLPGVARAGSARHPPFDYRELLGAESLFTRLRTRSNVIYPKEYKGSSYNDQLTEGTERRTFMSMDGFFRQCRKALRSRARYTLAYWPRFDTYCHRLGVAHEQTLAHFRELDKRFATLARRLPEGTTLIVSADHGLVDVPHLLHLDMHPQLLACLSAPLAGDARVAYCYVHPERVQAFTRYVRTRLRDVCDLKKSSELVRDGWYGMGKEHPMLRHRVGDYVLLLKPRWMIRDTVLGERRNSFVGHHSGLTREEMLVPLIVIQK